jgi:hypothetical protein
VEVAVAVGVAVGVRLGVAVGLGVREGVRVGVAVGVFSDRVGVELGGEVAVKGSGKVEEGVGACAPPGATVVGALSGAGRPDTPGAQAPSAVATRITGRSRLPKRTKKG